jgi:Domain of unknown function (DUF5658)
MSVSSLRILFFTLQVADLLTTLLVFRLGGFEANPLVAGLLPRLGPVAGLLAAKLAAVLIMLGLRSETLIRLGNMAYFGIVVWNVYVIWSLSASA